MHIAILVDALLAVFALEAVAMLAAWLLRRRDYALSAFLPYLVSVATGLLLATALLHLLPEAIATLGNTPRVWYLLAAGILGLFCVEQIVAAIVHTGDAAMVHVHAHGHAHHSLRPANLIVASSLHSFLDGVSVAAAHQRCEFSLHRLRESAAGAAPSAQPPCGRAADALPLRRRCAGRPRCRIARRLVRTRISTAHPALSFHSRAAAIDRAIRRCPEDRLAV